MKMFKWYWDFLKKYKFKMALGLMLTLLVSLMQLINPYIEGTIIDRVLIKGEVGVLIPLLSIIIGVTVFRCIVKFGYQMMYEHISQDLIFKMREEIYCHLQNQDFNFFDTTRTGDIMARLTGDIDAVRHFTAWVIYNVFDNFLTFTFAVVMIFFVNAKMARILLAITPIIAVVAYKMTNTVRPSFFAIREQFSKLNSVVQENISGNRVVKAFAKEEYEIEKFSRQNELFKEKNLDSSRIWEKYLPVLEFFASMLSIVLIIVGGIMVIRKNLTLGELVIINGYIWALNNPLRMAGWLINDIQRFFASIDRLINLVNEEPKIKNPKHPIQKEKVRGFVEFENVSFCYRDIPVLKNISFEVHPGQTVAIVGPTGSGKSTLINLICRFYDCNSGKIRIDNVDIKDMDKKELRDNIAASMQDIFLFSDTIEGNISYGNPNASMKQVQWAAQVADAHEFIESFPEGYDTIIGERGVGLSGGQKQRIALARALLKNPSILILDDTTSSVDIETEYKIHKTLKPFCENKTTFIIAHRISSVKNADLILVLNHGKIVERGTHGELLQKRGYYYDVFKNQMGDFDVSAVGEVC
ncbi:MAG: ABC transporter ATP-binding protein [Epulopiscium sp.]|nr:ABC transporter ATP-binding protein [Candidatus Epulonipiscium sp.]